MEPTPDITRLLSQVRLLEIVARKNAAGLLLGDYQTAVRGQGMVFHELRKYVPGDPVRRIDWNVTARVGEPYLKVDLEERRREVLIALDTSPSMHAGFQDRTKLEHAVEIAATLAFSAIEAGDRLGHVVFADRVLAESPPRGGRRQLFRTLRTLAEEAGPWTRTVAESDPRAAIHAIEKKRRGRLVVFLISDFIDHDVPDDLRYLRERHDVSLLHVYDPVEYAATDAVVLPAYAPEGARSRRAGVRPGETGTLDEMQRFLVEKAAQYGIDVESFSTAVPVRPALEHFFHRRRRRRR